MAFDATAIKALYAALDSHAKSLNLFQHVNMHEPENSPGTGLYCSMSVSRFEPFAAGSGLAATTAKLTFQVRIWSLGAKRQLSAVDPAVLGAMATLMGEYSGHFTLGGLVRDVELMSMVATGGWIEFEGAQCRVIDITLPLVINDAFGQGA